MYKHCVTEVFLYFYRSPSGWSGWMLGPVPGTGHGGIILEKDDQGQRFGSGCIERYRRGGWKYYDGRVFRADPTLRVECFYGDVNDFHHDGAVIGTIN